MAASKTTQKRAYGRPPAAAHARRMLKQKLRRALARINASRRPAGRQVRKVSCREVAKAANVSYNTVSRHLPNDARVRTRRINHNAPNTREQQLDCDRAARLFAR